MRIKLMSDEIELSCRRRDVDSLKTWVAEGVASACHKMVDTRNAVLKLFGRRRSPGEAQWLLLNWELVDWLRSPGSSICNWEDFWHCWHCWIADWFILLSSCQVPVPSQCFDSITASSCSLFRSPCAQQRAYPGLAERKQRSSGTFWSKVKSKKSKAAHSTAHLTRFQLFIWQSRHLWNLCTLILLMWNAIQAIAA